MKLTPVVLDFETFYAQDHTLRKMSPVDYVMHPDTEIQSCSITLPGKETVVVFGEKQLRQVFARMPWHKLYAIGHNMSGFDALILAWRFGINPAMWGCTMAMARPRYAKITPLSLDALLKYFKAPFEKGSLAATNTKGLRLAEFTPEMLEAIREYNKIDGDGCMWLFKRLIRETDWRELQLLDATIRMTVERRFVCDTELVASTLETVQAEKRAALLQVAELLDLNGIGEEELLTEARATLASQPKFAAVLTHYGFEVPMKVSKTAAAKGEHKLIPALAKSDDGMLELCESDHPVIGPAAQARLGVKSTQLETRLQTFLRWADVCDGTLPMPLHYCGADTSGRWSGAMGANVQNLPRLGKVKKHSDTLRSCLMAPKGHKVIVADQSGIELRVNHTLWQEEGSMALYQADPRADLYRAFASERYGVAPEEVSDAQRQLGKVCLVEGTLVLTDAGLIPIEKVSTSHRLWDGIEWVSHSGPVYNGVRDVITYDGITATPDHEVWVEDGRKMQLTEAASQSLRLARTGADRTPLGFSGAGVERNTQGEGSHLRKNSLYKLQCREAGEHSESAKGGYARVPVLSSEMRSAGVATPTNGGRTATMLEPKRRGVQILRCERGAVQLRQRSKCRSMGYGKLGFGARQGDRPNKHIGKLRTGQPAVSITRLKCRQQTPKFHEGTLHTAYRTPRGTLRRQHGAEIVVQGFNSSGHSVQMEHDDKFQTERRVWDILNAGPRNRFTANGRLVSNCHLGLGFGASSSAFVIFAKAQFGMVLDPDEAAGIVGDFRATYRRIAHGWRICGDALVDIYTGRERAIDPWGLTHTDGKGIRLPSGRLISYPGLHEETHVDKNGRSRKGWWYGVGRHRNYIYSSKAEQNIVQSLARDIIADNLLEFKKRTGFNPSHTVHDELIYIVPEREADTLLEELQTVMRTSPKYWPELVLWSEGASGDRYSDAK